MKDAGGCLQDKKSSALFKLHLLKQKMSIVVIREIAQ